MRPRPRRTWRLLPYYVYMTTVVTAFFPLAAMLVPELLGRQYSVGLVQLSFSLAGLHVLVGALIVLADWRGSISQFPAIARVQRHKWPWCRWCYVLVRYRDTRRWWKTSMSLSLAPVGVFYVTLAIAIG